MSNQQRLLACKPPTQISPKSQLPHQLLKTDRTAITERNAREAPFLRLPRELRDEICRLAVVHESSISLRKSKKLKHSGLGLASRQIYKEAAQVYWSKNAFDFEVTLKGELTRDIERIQKFAKATPRDQLAEIEVIQLWWRPMRFYMDQVWEEALGCKDVLVEHGVKEDAVSMGEVHEF